MRKTSLLALFFALLLATVTATSGGDPNAQPNSSSGTASNNSIDQTSQSGVTASPEDYTSTVNTNEVAAISVSCSVTITAPSNGCDTRDALSFGVSVHVNAASSLSDDTPAYSVSVGSDLGQMLNQFSEDATLYVRGDEVECSLNIPVTATVDVHNSDASATCSAIAIFNDDCAPVLENLPPTTATAQCDDLPFIPVVTASDMNDATIGYHESVSGDESSYLLHRRWTAIDTCGNTAEFTQAITVTDNEAPTIVHADAADEIEVYECDVEVPECELLAYDNCDAGPIDVQLKTEYRSVDPNNNKRTLYTRVYEAIDSSFNKQQYSHTIAFMDSTNPVLAGVPDDVTLECGLGLPDVATPSAADNCDGALDANFLGQATIEMSACETKITRSWSATDSAGNTISDSQTIIVQDTAAPELIHTYSSGDITNTDAGMSVSLEGECGQVSELCLVTAEDTCDGSVFVTVTETPDTSDPCLTTTVTRYSAMDQCGNGSVLEVTQTIIDSTPPQFSHRVPEVLHLEDCSVPDYDISAHDDCHGETVVSFSSESKQITDEHCDYNGKCPFLVEERTWTTQDVCGNSATMTQIVFLSDHEHPSLSPLPISSLTISCEDDIPDSNPIPYDNCECDDFGLEVATSVESECTGRSTIINTWSIADCAGNPFEYTQTIHVVDDTPPSFDTTPVLSYQYTFAEWQEMVGQDDQSFAPTLPGYSDTCSAATITREYNGYTPLDDLCFRTGQHSWTYTLSDECGNQDTFDLTVDLVDETAPTPTDPSFPADYFQTRTINTCEDSDADIHTDGQLFESQILSLFAGQDLDNYGSDQPGTTFVFEQDQSITDACDGSINRKVTLTDACGNELVYEWTIYIDDQTDPVYECNESDISNCNPLLTFEWSEDLVIPGGENTFVLSDDCASLFPTNAFSSNYGETHEGDCASNYTLTRVWTGIDKCGNEVSQVQVIVVVDTTPPVLVPLVDPEANDVCAASPAPVVSVDGGSFLDGYNPREITTSSECDYILSLQRTWMAEDCPGNSVSQIQNVAVSHPGSGPTWNQFPPDATINCADEESETEGCFSSPGTDPAVSATDACGNSDQITVCFTTTFVAAGPNDAHQGQYLRQYTATDRCGFESSRIQTITVKDTTPPSIDLVGGSEDVYECNVDAVPAVDENKVDAEEDCGDADVSILTQEFSADCSTITRYVFTATNDAGLTSQSVTYSQKIQDTLAPELSHSWQPNIDVECDYQHHNTLPPANDVCDVSVVVYREPAIGEAISFDHPLPHTGSINQQEVVKYIARDQCGHEDRFTQTITFTDTIDPNWDDAPVHTEQECIQGAALELDEPTSSDTCSHPDVTATPVYIEGSSCPREYTVSYQSCDKNNNCISTERLHRVRDTTPPQWTGTEPSTSLTFEKDEWEAYIAQNDPATYANVLESLTSDACSSTSAVCTDSDHSIFTPCEKQVIRTCRITDECGLELSHTVTFTIIDQIAPELCYADDADNCPVSLNNLQVQCAANVEDPAVFISAGYTVSFTSNNRDVSGANCFTVDRTWSVTDGCHDVDLEQTVTVNDDTSPLVTVEDKHEECRGDVSLYHTGLPDVSATDNCGSISVLNGLSCDAFSLVGANEWERQCAASYVDTCNNEGVDTGAHTVSDTLPPSWVENDHYVFVTGTGSVTLELPNDLEQIPQISVTDQCDGNETVPPQTTTTDEDCYKQTIYQWSHVDGAGLSTTPTLLEFTVTRLDTTPPQWETTPLPGDITIEYNSYVLLDYNQLVNNPVLSYSDSVQAGGSSHPVVEVIEGADAHHFDIKQTWTANDGCDNEIQYVRFITIVDTIAPDIPNMPDNVTEPCPYDEDMMARAETHRAAIEAELEGDHETLTITGPETSFLVECNDKVVYTFTFTVSDSISQKSVSALWTITVYDNEAPVFNLPLPESSIFYDCDKEDPEPVTAFDICDDQQYTATMDEEEIEAGLSWKRTWTVADACGNSRSHSSMVYVYDAEGPQPTPNFLSSVPQSIEVDCADNIPPAHPGEATDNCHVDTIFSEVTSATCINGLTTIRTWTFSDGNSTNDYTHTQVITVHDSEDPTFSGIQPLESHYECQLPVLGDAVVNDNCSPSTSASGSWVFLGGYSWAAIWNADDECGNSGQYEHQATLRDTEAPFLTFDSDDDQTYDCNEAIQWAQYTPQDNCDVDVLSDTISTTGNSCETVYTRTIVITDGVQHVTVERQNMKIDTTAPDLSPINPDSLTISCEDAGTWTPPPRTASDDCQVQVQLSYTQQTINYVHDDHYDILITWTAADGCGNVATETETFQVRDDIVPEISVSSTSHQYECQVDEVEKPDYTSSDTCSEVTVSDTTTFDDGTCLINGQYSVTYTAQDSSGNSAEATGFYLIQDTLSPEITYTVLAGATEYPASCPFDVCLEAQCALSDLDHLSKFLTPGTSDICDPNPSLTTSSPSPINPLTNSFYIQSADCSNNMDDLTVQVSSFDPTPPVITLPSDSVHSCVPDFSALPPPPASVAEDCGSAPIASIVSEALTGNSCEGSMTYHYSATNDHGATGSGSFKRSWSDTAMPTISVTYAGVTYTENAGPISLVANCDDAPTLDDFTYSASQDCDGDLTSAVVKQHNIISSDAYGVERHVKFIFSVSSACNGPVSIVFEISIVDEEAPTAEPAPGDVTAPCESPEDFEQLNLEDNCHARADLTVTHSDVANGLTDCGSVTRTWTVSDPTGNSRTYTAVKTIYDSTPPQLTFTDPSDSHLTVECVSEQPEPEASAVTVSDNCDETVGPVTSVLQLVSNPSTDHYKRWVRTYSVTDECGNVSLDLIQEIQEEDTVAPEVTDSVPEIIEAHCGEEMEGEPSFFDDCDGTSLTETYVTQDSQVGDCVHDVDIVRTWTATDYAGHTATVTQTYQFRDNSAPEWDAAFMATFEPTIVTQCEPTPANPPIAIDDCDGQLLANQISLLETAVVDEIDGNDILKTITREWTATDKCGHQSTLTQTVIVQDSEAPTISGAPVEGNFEYRAGHLYPLTYPGEVSATDDCAEPEVTLEEEIDYHDCGCGMTIHRTWSATDDDGKTSTITATVEITDNTAPHIEASSYPEGSIISAHYTEIPSIELWNSIQYGDACDVASQTVVDTILDSNIGQTDYESALYNLRQHGQTFTIQRTFTATDSCGNEFEKETTIIVKDIEPPVFDCPQEDMIIEGCVDDVLQTLPHLSLHPDTHPDENINIFRSTTNEGNNVYTVRTSAVDASGNENSHTFTVTIIDDRAPIFSREPASETLECDCTLTGSPPVPSLSAIDDCDDSVAVVFSQETSGNTYTNTWTASDSAGNVNTHVQIVTIEDTLAPVFDHSQLGQTSSLPDLHIECGMGLVEIESAFRSYMAKIIVIDECDSELPLDIDAIFEEHKDSMLNKGTFMIDLSATDEAGNSNSASFSVRVADTLAPAHGHDLNFIDCHSMDQVPDILVVPQLSPTAFTDACDAASFHTTAYTFCNSTRPEAECSEGSSNSGMMSLKPIANTIYDINYNVCDSSSNCFAYTHTIIFNEVDNPHPYCGMDHHND